MLEWFVDSASEFAPRSNGIMNLVNLVTGLAFLLTNGALVFFIVRYRRRHEGEATSRRSSNHAVEALWTIIPSIFFAVFYYVGVRDFVQLRASEADATQIRVTARQWAWEFTYPPRASEHGASVSRSAKSYNILYLEESRPVKLVMRSRDVIHSLYIPVFRVKEDVLANIYTFEQFVPRISDRQRTMNDSERHRLFALTEEQAQKIPQVADQCNGYAKGTCATYTFFCAEYCGKDHSYMLGSVVVLSSANYERKLMELEQATGAVSAEEGRHVYETAGCRSCHSVDGTRVVGPSWKGLWQSQRKLQSGASVKANENYIMTSIKDPGAQVVEGYPPVMPPQDLNDEQILSVIEYIKTLQ